MANIAAKTSSNVFYKARCAAAAHNEQLSSREGAADIMSIDRGRLYRIESGITNPYPEEIRLMADLYNAPELENYYCTNICPKPIWQILTGYQSRHFLLSEKLEKQRICCWILQRTVLFRRTKKEI